MPQSATVWALREYSLWIWRAGSRRMMNVISRKYLFGSPSSRIIRRPYENLGTGLKLRKRSSYSWNTFTKRSTMIIPEKVKNVDAHYLLPPKLRSDGCNRMRGALWADWRNSWRHRRPQRHACWADLCSVQDCIAYPTIPSIQLTPSILVTLRLLTILRLEFELIFLVPHTYDFANITIPSIQLPPSILVTLRLLTILRLGFELFFLVPHNYDFADITTPSIQLQPSIGLGSFHFCSMAWYLHHAYITVRSTDSPPSINSSNGRLLLCHFRDVTPPCHGNNSVADGCCAGGHLESLSCK
jgi:hypothetical protein